MTGESIVIEEYTEAFNKYFEVKAIQTKPKEFATIFLDITDRKNAEMKLVE